MRARNVYSIVILTYNEEENIGRTLSALPSDREIIVIDSGSNDKTHEIIKAFTNASLFIRPFDNLMNQWNFGHTKVSHDWVLSLDADYVVSSDLLQELESADLRYDSYEAGFKYCIFGKPIRSAVLPPRVVFYNRHKSVYTQDGHAQKVVVNGTCAKFAAAIYHDDRKPLSRWLDSQDKYSSLEIQKLFYQQAQYTWVDRIRMKTAFAPFLIFIYCYFIKGGFLEGRYGLYYAVQRLYAETIFLVKRKDRQIDETSNIKNT